MESEAPLPPNERLCLPPFSNMFKPSQFNVVKLFVRHRTTLPLQRRVPVVFNRLISPAVQQPCSRRPLVSKTCVGA
ncbi:hypothetical protein HanRHA438_Chr03g0142401 [Helianthus annuus]|nr:hypothetical protein HanIR_Chr03g0142451 [Helianthus annuus]KAJ0937461.1 hypothetical protein HanRHA438_Chr03g0142401 [Helianthus annuus]